MWIQTFYVAGLVIGGQLVRIRAQSSDFICGVDAISSGVTLPIGTTAITNFTIIHPRYTTKNGNPLKMLVPEMIHWHIYAIPDEENGGSTPSYSVLPAGWITPKVSDGILEFEVTDPKGLAATATANGTDEGYSKGDTMEAAVNLYIPISQIQNVIVSGGNNKVEVIIDSTLFSSAASLSSAPPSLNIEVSGYGHHLYVQAPDTSVDLKVTGIESRIHLKAGGTIPSSVSISGVANKVEFLIAEKNNTSTTPLHDVDLSGVDCYLLLEANYLQASISGVASTMRVVRDENSTDTENGGDGCFNVVTTGVDVNCEIITTEHVTVPALSCAATTTVVKASSSSSNNNDWSRGQTIGVVVGVLGAIVLGMLTCMYFCGCFGCGRGRQAASAEMQPPPLQHLEFSGTGPEPADPYATVPLPATATAIQPTSEESVTPAKIY